MNNGNIYEIFREKIDIRLASVVANRPDIHENRIIRIFD